MSDLGMLTGFAGLEILRQKPDGRAGVFCLGGLATEAPLVLKRADAAKRIMTVDGCPLNFALKIVEGAGYSPDVKINPVDDCGLKKGKPFTHTEEDLQVAVAAIRPAID